MSERKAKYRANGGARHLHVVGPDPEPAPEETEEQAKAQSQETGGRTPSESLQDAIMFAACSWAAVAREDTPSSVSIAPIGGGVYQVDVELASGAPGAVLRMDFMLEAGLKLRITAEPVRPG